MKANLARILSIALMIAGFALASTAYAATINYTTAGWGPTQFPGPVTPPANAPWGPNGYPGDTVEIQGFGGTLDLTPGTYTQSKLIRKDSGSIGIDLSRR